MHQIGIGLLICGLLFVAPTVWADPRIRVPQTGQTTSYDANTPPRDDGALQEGVSLSTPRFADLGDGTIKDNLTGLIWLKKADCAFAGRTWQQSLDDVVSLNATGTMNDHDCGDQSNHHGTHQTDWRLPNLRELHSLIHYGFFQPALSNPAGTAQAQCLPPIDCPFSFTVPDIGLRYWSSTTRFTAPVEAWWVDLTEGLLGFEPVKTQPVAPGTLPVRGRSE